MIEIEPTKVYEGIKSDLVAEQFLKLQHACKHDEQMETVAGYLNDPNEVSDLYQDLRGTRRIIFGLLIDLGIV